MNLLSKTSLQPLKGMLDDFPEQYAEYLLIKSAIDSVAKSFGYEGYEAPVLEPVSLYTSRTSREILEEQSYLFTDKGKREIILRPEVTQSLARMAACKVKEAALPLRWYSLMKCYRYERPQKGRLREFRQLNVDFLNAPTANIALADLEIFQIIYRLMEAFKVPPRAYRIYYNHRGIVNAILMAYQFNETERLNFYKLIDKKAKMSADMFEQLLAEQFDDDKQKLIKSYITSTNISDLIEKFPLLKKDEANHSMLAEVERFIYHAKNLSASFSGLKAGGLWAVMQFNPTTVRGLDYYTGIVFEVFDVYQAEGNDEKSAGNDEKSAGDNSNSDVSHQIGRSLFGGGRYDNLVEQFSNDKLSGVGFGMGLYIVSLFLKRMNCFFCVDKSFVKDRYFIAYQTHDNNTTQASPYYLAALAVASFWRDDYTNDSSLFSRIVELSTVPVKMSKGLKKATQSKAHYFIFIGEDELTNKTYRCRNLQKGMEEIFSLPAMS